MMSFEKPLGCILSQTKRVYRHKLMAGFKANNVDLSLSLYIIMLQIELNEAITQQFLADYLQKDKSIVMRQINTLIEKGFVEKTSNKQDKRKKNLVLTTAGQEMLELIHTLALRVSEELFAGISYEDRHTFEQVIRKITENGTIK